MHGAWLDTIQRSWRLASFTCAGRPLSGSFVKESTWFFRAQLQS
ncbi:hypothetical protein [Arthrobacter methylotrophus]